MIELYYGEGKGKTTAATGAALRAAGHGIPVVFAQFLKDGSSGEVKELQKIPEVTVILPENNYGFANEMNDDQKDDTKKQYQFIFNEIDQMLDRYRNFRDGDNAVKAVVVLDEVLHAIYFDLMSEEILLRFLDKVPSDIEVILTGWYPSEIVKSKADYITKFECERHPFNKGIIARVGIEL